MRKQAGLPTLRVRLEVTMLTWALTFFLIAILAALFGFTGIAGAATSMAKVLFFVFLVLFIISSVMHLSRGRTPRLQ